MQETNQYPSGFYVTETDKSRVACGAVNRKNGFPKCASDQTPDRALPVQGGDYAKN